MTRNKHTSYDLVQMQSLPLETKIEMTKRRIEEWYKAWKMYTIVDRKTGKTRHVTWTEEPNETGCFRKKVKTVDGQNTEIDVMVSGTKLKPTEYVDSCEDGQVYVSFSGGKDSTVLKHIINSMGLNIPFLFIDTGLEFPEIREFAKSHSDVTFVRPDMRFDQVISKYGYPIISKDVSQKVAEARNAMSNGYLDSYALKRLHGTYVSKLGKTNRNIQKYEYLLDADFGISNICCSVMKKAPAISYETETGRKPLLGTLACESQLRSLSWVEHGCNAFDMDRPSSKPLSFWTDNDILEYLYKYDVPYCSVYGKIYLDHRTNKYCTSGYSRTGCVFCGFGCHMQNPNSFQRLAKSHPKLYDYCIHGGAYVNGAWKPTKEGLGMGHVLDYIGVSYIPDEDMYIKLFE